jgi:enoyl-CoA hydratase/carnithine racemase
MPAMSETPSGGVLSPDALVRDGRVQISVADGVALIRLNRPEKMNAFDAEQLDAFEAALQFFLTSPDVRVGVLTGGERAFSAGGDITTFDTIDVDAGQPYTRRGYDLLRPLETGEKPIIAAVDGYCLAGGFEMVLACDFIIAGQKATFGFGEVRLGLIPAFGGTVRLARAISPRMARQLTLTNERIGAERAFALGLVNEVVDPSKTVVRAVELATLIAAQPPLAVRAVKMATHLAADGGGTEGALAAERAAGAMLFGTEAVHRQVRAWSGQD